MLGSLTMESAPPQSAMLARELPPILPVRSASDKEVLWQSDETGKSDRE